MMHHLSLKKTGFLFSLSISLVLILLISCSTDTSPSPMYTLTIINLGEGRVEPSQGAYEFQENTMVNIKAISSPGWEFKGWLGDVAHHGSAETTVLMDGDKTIEAFFVIYYDQEEEVRFEDRNLEKAVREAIKKERGPLLVKDVSNLVELFAVGRGIESLEGIQYLQSLERLYFSRDWARDRDNSIANLSPLSSLLRLKHLDLSYNQVKDLSPLQNLERLEALILGHNQVEDIAPLIHLASLAWLSLWDNQIEDISPLKDMAPLEFLDLSYNRVADLSPLEGHGQLEILDIGGNPISDYFYLDELLRSFYHIREISLYDLGIDNLSFVEEMPYLEGLFIGENQISDLSPLSHASKLRLLNFWGNQVESIEPLKGLAQLESLDFSYNQVEDLAPLVEVTNLYHLSFYHNQVREIGPLLQNTGLGAGAYINMSFNYLDLSEGSLALEHIEALLLRGVTVEYEKQREL